MKTHYKAVQQNKEAENLVDYKAIKVKTYHLTKYKENLANYTAGTHKA